MFRSNFHTHCTHCDGKNTAEENILSAIEKGFTSIGFSSHYHTDCDLTCGMLLEKTQAYIDDIMMLKKKYAGKINVYCGTELDYWSPPIMDGFEYTIGSVHYLLKKSETLHIDASAVAQLEAVKKYYGGDYMAYAEEYYSLVGDVFEKTHCDIIGHVDLITKFNEDKSIFDTQDKRYVAAWQQAMDKLLKTGAVFEVNTGAISRNYRTKPYPEPAVIEYIKEHDGTVVVTADSHRACAIDCAFEETYKLIEKIGVRCIDFEEILKGRM